MEKNDKKKISLDTIGKLVVIVLIAIMCVAITLTTVDKSSEGKAGMGKMPGPPGTEGGKGGMVSQSSTAITVNAYKIESSNIESIIKLNGNIGSKVEVNIFPDTSGKLVRLLKDDGAYVNKNEVIAYVDPSKPGSAYATSPVFSTVSGNIISTPANVGDTVTSNTAIASVGSLDDLKITVNVSEKYSNDLKLGLSGYISLTSIPNESFVAKISKISPVVDKTKRTIEVTLDFVKKDSRIKPGMFGSVRLATKHSNNTIVIPKSALSTYNAENCVYIIDENQKAKRCFVKIGLSNDTMVEILQGLEYGQTVITAGSVTEGTLVRIAGGQ